MILPDRAVPVGRYTSLIVGKMASARFADMPVVSILKGGLNTAQVNTDVRFAGIKKIMGWEIFCMAINIASRVQYAIFKLNTNLPMLPLTSVACAVFAATALLHTPGITVAVIAAVMSASTQVLTVIKSAMFAVLLLLPANTMCWKGHIKAVIFMKQLLMDKAVTGNTNTIQQPASGRLEVITW